MYLLDGDIGKRKTDAIARTKEQLQVISKNEVSPEGKQVIAGKPKTFVVERIVGKKVIKGKVYYLTKWKGWKEVTEEPRTTLIKMIPKLIQEYEQTH